MKSLFLFFSLVLSLTAISQKIAYSEAEREDSRRTTFEVIGKMNGNYLVFKNNRSDNAISVYNSEMKLVDRVDLDFLPDRWINTDFIAYPEFAYLIYQWQRKNVVYCNMVKIDSKGKPVGEPTTLDTTQIGFAANNKIYSVLTSEDKQKIMIFKINSKNTSSFLFTTMLFDNSMKLIIDKQRMSLPMQERNDFFTDFYLDNDGDLVFGKLLRNGGNDFISNISLVSKAANEEKFLVTELVKKERVLDDIKIKIDNTNKRYLLTGFYYKQRKGNIEGLFTASFDKNLRAITDTNFIVFSDEIRMQAKSSEASAKMAFNDYFIKNILLLKDGRFAVISESEYTTSRGGAFNRWDNTSWNNPWSYSSYDNYYSPSSRFNSPWNRWSNTAATRYHAENILILTFNKDSKLNWSNVIPKTQFDDESDNLISHQLIITGGQLHVLYNQYERKNLLLHDQSIGPDGKITRYPTLKNLDRGYEFMPRHGKQVSANEMILPCLYRNYLCFAKLEF